MVLGLVELVVVLVVELVVVVVVELVVVVGRVVGRGRAIGRRRRDLVVVIDPEGVKGG